MEFGQMRFDWVVSISTGLGITSPTPSFPLHIASRYPENMSHKSYLNKRITKSRWIKCVLFIRPLSLLKNFVASVTFPLSFHHSPMALNCWQNQGKKIIIIFFTNPEENSPLFKALSNGKCVSERLAKSCNFHLSTAMAKTTTFSFFVAGLSILPRFFSDFPFVTFVLPLHWNEEIMSARTKTCQAFRNVFFTIIPIYGEETEEKIGKDWKRGKRMLTNGWIG